MRRRYLLPFAVLAATFALSVSDAFALSPVINDCTQHSKLTRHYTIPELQHALATLPVGTAEYTNCFTVISDQLHRQLAVVPKPSDTGTGSGGSFLPTPVLIAVILIVVVGGGFAYSSRKRGPGGGGTPPTAAGDS